MSTSTQDTTSERVQILAAGITGQWRIWLSDGVRATPSVNVSVGQPGFHFQDYLTVAEALELSDVLRVFARAVMERTEAPA